MSAPGAGSSWFQRFLLPGFAFKAVIIGGGYATGRELVEYFLPAGPVGRRLPGHADGDGDLERGLRDTFLFAAVDATVTTAPSSRTCSGPLWFIFEIAYLLFIMLILAVFGAARARSAKPSSAGPSSARWRWWSGSSPSSPSATSGRAAVQIRLVLALRRLRPVPGAGAVRRSATASLTVSPGGSGRLGLEGHAPMPATTSSARW
jgi:hypothetical protein